MGRPTLLRQTLTRLFESTKGINLQAVVLIDGDKESYSVCVQLGLTYPNITISYSDTRRGAIPCWNYGTRIAQSDMFFHMGDDLDFVDGWLDIALEAHRTKLGGYGLVGVNDSMHDGNTTVATHALFDKKFAVDFLGGVMATPVYAYYNVDKEFTERARRAGRYYWCKEAVVKHLHPANNGRPVDETDRSHMDFWTQDLELYEKRQAAGFPNNFPPVLWG